MRLPAVDTAAGKVTWMLGLLQGRDIQLAHAGIDTSFGKLTVVASWARRPPSQTDTACPRSLSDLGGRSEDGGRARPDNPDFEAHSGPTQQEIGVIMDRYPTAAVDSS